MPTFLFVVLASKSSSAGGRLPNASFSGARRVEAPSGMQVAAAVLFVLLGFQNPIQHSTGECPVDAPTLTGYGDFSRVHSSPPDLLRVSSTNDQA